MPSDFQGMTTDNEWRITVTIAAIESMEEDGTTNYGLYKQFEAEGPTKEAAISGVIKEVRSFLEGEIHERRAQLTATTDPSDEEAAAAERARLVITDPLNNLIDLD